MRSEEAPVRMQQRKKIVVIIANPLKTAIPHGSCDTVSPRLQKLDPLTWAWWPMTPLADPSTR